MVLVDRRVGSADLLKPLQAAGLQAELVELEFADLAFLGKGPNNTTLNIGIELKKIPDLVGSLRSGRLSGHQLPGLRASYDYSFLVIEGRWDHDAGGKLITQHEKSRKYKSVPGRISVAEMEKHVLTLELCGGLHIRYCPSRRDTLRFITHLYRWFSDKPMDQHHSHLKRHDAPTLVPVSAFRDAVMKFPGVGYRTSKSVEAHFGGSMRRAVMAGVDEWAGISTMTDKGQPRRLGAKVAERIVEFCVGGGR